MNFLERAWYKQAAWLWLLWPVSLLYQLISSLRRSSLSSKAAVADTSQAPVIIVGNITLGGTGKTPLLIALCKHFQEQGKRPGVISRGYGGKANTYPMFVDADTAPEQAGDEPVLIARKTGVPVMVDPDRVRALQTLQQEHELDIILSDDGLQHYALPRQLEIVVVDGGRLFANELCLPAGPLREPVSRLRSVDFLVLNGESEQTHPALSAAYPMTVKPRQLVNLATGEKRPFAGAPFNIGNTLQAVAAIGNPDRFFSSLRSLPYPLREFRFPDHHLFSADDFDDDRLDAHQPIVMTEKDAVKCRGFASNQMWYVDIDIELPAELLSAIDGKLGAE